jgi:RHS repeat-associated protein
LGFTVSLETLASRVSVTAPLGLPEVAADPLNVGIVWDAENRLTEVRQGPTTLASFVYDGRGRRQQKVAGGVTHTYISDRARLIEERISTGQTPRYVEGPGIDQHLAMQDGAAVTYYAADHLGSVVQEANASGVVTLARNYDPWGNLLAGAGAAGWSFTGREWDPEAGLAYYRARYLDPKLGRFISEDPIGLRGGPNRYAYVYNSPMNLVDPTGEAGVAVAAPLVFSPEPFTKVILVTLVCGTVIWMVVQYARNRQECSCVCYRKGRVEPIGQQPSPEACSSECIELGYNGYKCGGSVVWNW